MHPRRTHGFAGAAVPPRLIADVLQEWVRKRSEYDVDFVVIDLAAGAESVRNGLALLKQRKVWKEQQDRGSKMMAYVSVDADVMDVGLRPTIKADLLEVSIEELTRQASTVLFMCVPILAW